MEPRENCSWHAADQPLTLSITRLVVGLDRVVGVELEGKCGIHLLLSISALADLLSKVLEPWLRRKVLIPRIVLQLLCRSQDCISVPQSPCSLRE